MNDIRQPTNKTLIEEVIIKLDGLLVDVKCIKNDIKDINESLAIQKINEDKLQKGQNLDDSGWWIPFR
tara:strand:- start:3521 stop:3724 length:204 start_codon:yes stop_codon:yes gene_type:complete